MPRPSTDDPLSRALAPPPDETPDDRTRRLREEAEARKRSDAIDEAIRAERAAMKKEKASTLKILLLGQAESGAQLCKTSSLSPSADDIH